MNIIASPPFYKPKFDFVRYTIYLILIFSWPFDKIFISKISYLIGVESKNEPSVKIKDWPQITPNYYDPKLLSVSAIGEL